jgi:hypothetical protein
MAQPLDRRLVTEASLRLPIILTQDEYGSITPVAGQVYIIVQNSTEVGDDVIWAQSNFLGGGLGSQVTEVTEPIFSARSGTSLTYGAGVAGSTRSMEVMPANSGALRLDLGGRSKVRIAFDVERGAGVITAGMLVATFAEGVVNRGDLFLRNQNNGNWALRNNFAYSGQSTHTFAVGETMHIEMKWEYGVGFTTYLWFPGNATNAPDETLTSAETEFVDNIVFGNSTGSTGVNLRFGSFRATAGGAYRA